MQRTSPIPPKTAIANFRLIARYWLALGYIALLTGLFWVANASLYTKVFYGLVAFPALLLLLSSPQVFRCLLREPIVLAYLAFIAWLLLSLAWSQSETSFGSLAKRPLYVFMMFAACTLMALQDKKFILGALRIAALISVLAALACIYLHFTQTPSRPRLIGTGALRNPLLTSHVLGFFSTYWLASWLTRNERHNLIAIVCALPLLLALFLTGSRTPLLALGITCLWMLVMTPRRGVYLILGLSLLVTSVLLENSQWLTHRGVSFRPQLWSEAFKQSLEHFWFGRGYDSSFTFAIAKIGYLLTDPHNVELAVLLQLGVVGLSLWLVMYLATYWQLLREKNQRCMQIASALVTYGLAAGLTEGSNFLSRPNENWFLIWIPLSLVAALSIQLRQNKP